jgi:hypothetical protein
MLIATCSAHPTTTYDLPFTFAGLNKTHRQQLYDIGAHIWKNEHGVDYLEAGLRAAEDYEIRVPTYYNHSLKNGKHSGLLKH